MYVFNCGTCETRIHATMNIFVLSLDILECAEQMVDAHVVKMILEYCQLLSTAHHVLDAAPDVDIIYKPTHVNHPCARWVRESSENYYWLVGMLKALLYEYTFRYAKVHACSRLLTYFEEHLPDNIPDRPMTPFPLAMPDECKVEGDPVESYRRYYINSKQKLFKWRGRQPPAWISCPRDTRTPDPLQ